MSNFNLTHIFTFSLHICCWLFQLNNLMVFIGVISAYGSSPQPIVCRSNIKSYGRNRKQPSQGQGALNILLYLLATPSLLHFFLYFVFATVNCFIIKFCRFEPRTSGIGSNRYANCPTSQQEKMNIFPATYLLFTRKTFIICT